MQLQTYQTVIVDTVVYENGILKIPELSNKASEKVHVVIMFQNEDKSTHEKSKSLAGSLHNYARPELIDTETEKIWDDLNNNHR